MTWDSQLCKFPSLQHGPAAVDDQRLVAIVASSVNGGRLLMDCSVCASSVKAVLLSIAALVHVLAAPMLWSPSAWQQHSLSWDVLSLAG